MKDKRLILGVAVFLLIVLGGIFILYTNKKPVNTKKSSQVNSILSLKPEEIGLKLTLSPDRKRVKFSADKLKDVKRLEWEFSYDADIPVSDVVPAEQGGKVTQSFGGEADIKPGQNSYESIFRELGTCSTGGLCRFDKGISKVNLILKVTKTDGKIYQIQDSISL